MAIDKTRKNVCERVCHYACSGPVVVFAAPSIANVKIVAVPAPQLRKCRRCQRGCLLAQLAQHLNVFGVEDGAAIVKTGMPREVVELRHGLQRETRIRGPQAF